MCNYICISNSTNINNFPKYSKLINLIQIILNSLIIFFTFLCFISCNLDYIIKTGYIYYINNIFFCFLMLLVSVFIYYYNKKKELINNKKQASIYFIMVCFCVTMINCFITLIVVVKLKRNYISKRYNNYYIKEISLIKQAKLLFIYLLIIFVLYLSLGIFYLINTTLIYNWRTIALTNEFNNEYNNRGNMSYLSTKSDINDNNQDIIINNLNEGNKNNNFCFLSQNIINKIEKEFEDKECQTSIKGIINK